MEVEQLSDDDGMDGMGMGWDGIGMGWGWGWNAMITIIYSLINFIDCFIHLLLIYLF